MFLTHLNAGRSVVRMAAKSAGLQAARLDYDPQEGQLYLSIIARGEVKQIPIPTSRAFTTDQLIEILFPAGEPEIAAADSSPP